MRALLRRLLGRGEQEEPPLTPRERRKLEHRYRVLERRARRAAKAVDRRGCASCTKAEDPLGFQMARRARLLEEEVSRLGRRLARD